MTLPSEQLYALNRTRDLLRSLLTGPRMPMIALRSEASSCLRHYPGQYTLEQRWAEDVCEHGKDRQFCRDCDKPTEESK
jgi:hypothetical protein